MTRNLKISLLAVFMVILLGAAFLGSSKIEAETQKKATGVIGFVDIQAVFEAHPEKEVAEQKLNDEVQTMQAQLEKEVKDQTQEQRQVTMQKYQDQLAQREEELISQVIATIDEVIREVADESGIQVVLEKKSVIYGGEDLTQQVKDRIQQKYSNK